jgi:uroporphyrinogen decarboxylase
MRQAGRYLPEYRKLREGTSFLEMCRDVDKAVEVSLQPVRAVGTEAVVFFSDIFIPVVGMGVELTFAPGPVIADPIRNAAQVEDLGELDPERALPYVLEILRRLRVELRASQIPLIGFAGAPFTLATYLVEGKGDPTRKFQALRQLLKREPEVLRSLLDRLAEMTVRYLNAQVEAGAQVVQLFDTWAGALAEEEYRNLVLPVNRRIAAGLDRAAAPLILYINDAPHLVEAMLDCECDVISVGAAVEIGTAARLAGSRASVQGNLDPAELASPPPRIAARVREIASAAGPARGHVLNLGHGCLPDTPVEGVRAFVAAARSLGEGTG